MIENISSAASMMGKRSAAKEKERVGKDAYIDRRREIGALGGRAKAVRRLEEQIAKAVRAITLVGFAAGVSSDERAAVIADLPAVCAAAGIPAPTTDEEHQFVTGAIRKALAEMAEIFRAQLDALQMPEVI
jgi:hypothetical protein